MRRIVTSLLLAATMFMLLPASAVQAQEEEDPGYALVVVSSMAPADRAAYRSAMQDLAAAAAEAGVTNPWWAWSHDAGFTVVVGFEDMSWLGDQSAFWSQFPESAQAAFRSALAEIPREVTTEISRQVMSWSYSPADPLEDEVSVAHVHHDWLKPGAGEAYGQLAEDWVAFLGKIGYPYRTNCMRTVVGAQKITCVDFADSMSRYTSDETWDDLIKAAGAEEEYEGLQKRWQGLVARWEHGNASFRKSMSYWPGMTD
jgi:hypothetical protein